MKKITTLQQLLYVGVIVFNFFGVLIGQDITQSSNFVHSSFHKNAFEPWLLLNGLSALVLGLELHSFYKERMCSPVDKSMADKLVFATESMVPSCDWRTDDNAKSVVTKKGERYVHFPHMFIDPTGNGNNFVYNYSGGPSNRYNGGSDMRRPGLFDGQRIGGQQVYHDIPTMFIWSFIKLNKLDEMNKTIIDSWSEVKQLPESAQNVLCYKTNEYLESSQREGQAELDALKKERESCVDQNDIDSYYAKKEIAFIPFGWTSMQPYEHVRRAVLHTTLSRAAVVTYTTNGYGNKNLLLLRDTACVCSLPLGDKKYVESITFVSGAANRWLLLMRYRSALSQNDIKKYQLMEYNEQQKKWYFGDVRPQGDDNIENVQDIQCSIAADNSSKVSVLVRQDRSICTVPEWLPASTLLKWMVERYSIYRKSVSWPPTGEGQSTTDNPAYLLTESKLTLVEEKEFVSPKEPEDVSIFPDHAQKRSWHAFTAWWRYAYSMMHSLCYYGMRSNNIQDFRKPVITPSSNEGLDGLEQSQGLPILLIS